MSFHALIPLRGGSKSIPFKNIKCIAGKPLFAWSAEAALASGIFDRVVVSTDCSEIATQVERYFGEQVMVVRRPSELATDTASSECVMRHYLDKNSAVEKIALVQATNPFVTAEDFRNAREKFKGEGSDSLLSVSVCKRFFWSFSGKAENYDPADRPRRQDFSGNLIENGAFYFTSRKSFDLSGHRLGGKISYHTMPEWTSYEIDEPSDWTIVESLLCQHKTIPALKNIRALLVDVDGTLTDGGMYYSSEGEMLKKFNTKDAHGMKLLEKEGFIICVITAESSPSVDSRIKKLGFENYFKGIKDKLPVVKKFASEKSLQLSEIAYIGDDLGDAEVMKSVGFSACPLNGEEVILNLAHYVTKRAGGDGAVREVCDLILKSKKQDS